MNRLLPHSPPPRRFSRPPVLGLLALMAAVIVALPLALAQESPPKPTLSELRSQMRALQAEREGREQLAGLVELQTLTTTLELREAQGRVALRLDRDLEAFNVVWLFEPVDVAGQAETVRLPQCRNGQQWIVLDRGRWRLTLVLGRAGQREIHTLPACEFRLLRDRAYSLEVGEAVEKALLSLERRAEFEANIESEPTPEP